MENKEILFFCYLSQRRNQHLSAVTNSGEKPLPKVPNARSIHSASSYFKNRDAILKCSLPVLEQIQKYFTAHLPIPA